MLVRAIALSLALLIGVGAIVPLATDSVEAGPKNKRKQKRVKKYKKYSKGWWRQYRARQRKKVANRNAARALRLRQLRRQRAINNGQAPTAKVTKPKASSTKTAVLPSGKAAPNGWSASQTSSSELRFRVDDSAGSQVGSASISVVGPASGDAPSSSQRKSVGGVATAALRRDVINKMIQENGWVVNDFEKEIGGRSVYVVVAQSQAKNGGVQSRMFYFTEVDGRIYSVATNSPVEQQERLAAESEKVLDSLQTRVRNAERAAVKE